MARPRLEKPTFRLKRLGTGIFHIRWTDNGRTRSRTTGSRDQNIATAHLARFIAAYNKPALPDEPTVRDIVAAFVESRSKEVRAVETLKFSSRPVIERMGNLLPANIGDEDVKLYARERGRAGGTIIRELGVLKAAGGWAVRQKLISQPITFKMPVAHPMPKDRWITKAEAGRLMGAINAPHLKLFVLLALGTAARSGAILTLTWRQVDFARGLIDYGEGHGNKRRSIIPINNKLRSALDDADKHRTTDHVIEYGGKPVKAIKNGFADAVERAELKDVTPHTLRHTAATWMIMEGVALSKVARYLGDTEKTVERVYGHHAPDYLKEAANALEF